MVDGLPDGPEGVVGRLLGRLGRRDLLRGVAVRIRLLHAHVRDEEVQDGHEEGAPRDHDGVDEVGGDALDVQGREDRGGLLLRVVARVGPARGAVAHVEGGAVDAGRVAAALHVGEEARVLHVPLDVVQQVDVGEVDILELALCVLLVVDEDVGALEDVSGAALAARRPRAVAEAEEELGLLGDAHHGLRVEVGEDGGEGGVDHEGHEEQEGEGADAGDEGEDRREVEAEGVLPFGLLLGLGEGTQPRRFLRRRLNGGGVGGRSGERKSALRREGDRASLHRALSPSKPLLVLSDKGKLRKLDQLSQTKPTTSSARKFRRQVAPSRMRALRMGGGAGWQGERGLAGSRPRLHPAITALGHHLGEDGG